jgi:hypothetical protein
MRDTLEMAREARLEEMWEFTTGFTKRLKAFEALVRADERSIEREACAKVCEDQKYMILEPLRTYSAHDICDANKRTALYLSKVIRARGETK